MVAKTVSEPLPSREVLEGRLDSQRRRIYQAANICKLAMSRCDDDCIEAPDSAELEGALSVAEEILQAVASALDPGELLADQATEEAQS